MSRNGKIANQAIFGQLINFCRSRDVEIKDSGSGRWIKANRVERVILRKGTVSHYISFGPTRKIVKISVGTREYVCTVGFDQTTPPPHFGEVQVGAGLLIVIASELAPRPTATANEIKDVIEYDHAGVVGYSGYGWEEVSSLYPKIMAYRDTGYKFAAENLFFKMCLQEIEFTDSWVDDVLSGTLSSLTELDPKRLPYRTLCRSIFDEDPTTFFLSLYRCLEALYSYKSAKAIVDRLKLPNSWEEVSAVLEDKLNWHPREEGSLASLLVDASEGDLRQVLTLMDSTAPQPKRGELPTMAARRIYNLRNGIVHYRPLQHQEELDKYDWNGICTAMTGIVIDVYHAVFG